jgi:hypothetical protein
VVILALWCDVGGDPESMCFFVVLDLPPEHPSP